MSFANEASHSSSPPPSSRSSSHSSSAVLSSSSSFCLTSSSSIRFQWRGILEKCDIGIRYFRLFSLVIFSPRCSTHVVVLIIIFIILFVVSENDTGKLFFFLNRAVIGHVKVAFWRRQFNPPLTVGKTFWSLFLFTRGPYHGGSSCSDVRVCGDRDKPVCFDSCPNKSKSLHSHPTATSTKATTTTTATTKPPATSRIRFDIPPSPLSIVGW